MEYKNRHSDKTKKEEDMSVWDNFKLILGGILSLLMLLYMVGFIIYESYHLILEGQYEILILLVMFILPIIMMCNLCFGGIVNVPVCSIHNNNSNTIVLNMISADIDNYHQILLGNVQNVIDNFRLDEIKIKHNKKIVRDINKRIKKYIKDERIDKIRNFCNKHNPDDVRDILTTYTNTYIYADIHYCVIELVRLIEASKLNRSIKNIKVKRNGNGVTVSFDSLPKNES